MPKGKVYTISAGSTPAYEIFKEDGWIKFRTSDDSKAEYKMAEGIENALIKILKNLMEEESLS